MILGKLWIPLICLLLIFGFFMMRGTITTLEEKTEKLDQTQQKLKTDWKEWQDRKEDDDTILTQATPDPPPAEERPGDASAEAPDTIPAEPNDSFSCTLRAYDGKIGIFTPQGYLIRLLDVDLRTLPSSDLAALEEGVPIASRAELWERIADFGG